MNIHQNKSGFLIAVGLRWLAGTMQRFLAPLSLLLLAGSVAAVERPFQGRINGQFVASPTADPTVYVGGAQAVGIATHIGTFTKVTSDVSNIATGEVDGLFTITAPDGDLLTGVYDGFITFGRPGSFSWVLNATFTGGSGRFIGATGTFVFLAAGELIITDGVVYGTYTETFEGTIDY